MAVVTVSSCGGQRTLDVNEPSPRAAGPTSAYLLGLRVVAQPRPAGALDAEGGGVDGLLETVEAAKVLLDLVVELARRRELAALGRGRGKVLPEEGLPGGNSCGQRACEELAQMKFDRTWLMWPEIRRPDAVSVSHLSGGAAAPRR